MARTSLRAMAPTERNSATAIWWMRNISRRNVKNLHSACATESEAQHVCDEPSVDS